MRAVFAALLLCAGVPALRPPMPPAPPQEPSAAAVKATRPQAIARPAIQIPGPDGKAVPARLRDLSVDVQIVGSLAVTTWDFTLYNPQDRILEGEFVFPLGDGQTVSRFAMDVNGALREGVVVDKAKGRQAFEEIVRRGVDPGLLEKLEGNVFRARVYPIPAKGSKRVVIAYEQELGASAKAPSTLRYTLPLDLPAPVDRFHLKVEVLEQALRPAVEGSPFDGFELSPWQRAYRAEGERRDFQPARPLVLDVPRPPDAFGSFVEEAADGRYAYASLLPLAKRAPKAAPRRLLVAWDASASAAKRDRAKELDLLARYLQRLGTADVALCVFRNEAEPLRRFTVRGGDASALRRAIESEPLDGATTFGALKLDQEAADEVLLFSDGLSTLGSSEARFPDAPLVAVNSAAVAAPAFLHGLAGDRGGELVDLASGTVDEALEALRTRPLAFLGATVESGRATDLLPGKGALVRGAFGLAAKLGSETATLRLAFGHGRSVEFTKTVVLGQGSAAPARRLWAQKKLADLARDPEGNRAAMVDLGTRFSIVTEGTSLIVLDSLEDYVRYRIEPPAEMREAYFQRVKAEDASAQRQERDRLDQVLAQWKERQAWWERTFDPPPVKDKGQAISGGGVGHVTGQRTASGAAPPPPAEAPRPAPAATATAMAEAAPGRAQDQLSRLQRKAAKREAGPDAAKSLDRDEAKEEADDHRAASIQLKAWNPDTPYLKTLRTLPKASRYGAYLDLRKDWEHQPGFFLDVADLLREDGDARLALRVLSNLAELKLEDAALFRVLGHRLGPIHRADLAVWVFDKVKTWRPEEPQSTRDLALACAEAGQPQRAADLLWEVVKGRWDGRFRDVNLIALGELNALLAREKGKIRVQGMDAAFLRNLPVDVRVVLNWDTNDSDMDLHVVDPRGETCFYGHQATALGGRISADVTGGYGPEEFLLKRAVPGRYLIKANYYGTRQQTVIGATTVKLELYLRYGTGRMENKSVILRLTGESRMVDVGAFVFGE
ncbi:MAG: VIT domain-containing protein [Holophagaceae bacterium]